MVVDAFRKPRISATAWVVVACAIGAATCALAGLYPRFDEGKLRLVLALTSMPFAGAVGAFAMRSGSASGAVGRTLGTATVLGVASTIVPSAILSWGHESSFGGCVVFGVFFGIPTGFLYGIPLAVLTGFAHRHVRSPSLAGTDRTARTSALFIAIASGLAALAGYTLDGLEIHVIVAATFAVMGLAIAIASHVRVCAREAWIDRVRSGLEPKYRLRIADPRDNLVALPRITAGHSTVVEWIAEDAVSTSVYRLPAIGTPVAVVGVLPPTT